MSIGASGASGAIGAIGAAAVNWSASPAGVSVDPETQRAQAGAQADLLNALRGIGSAGMVADRVSDGKGVDLYL